MKYFLRRNRGAFVTLAMVVGALFVTSTLANVLDMVMRRKAPPPSAEVYIPPKTEPTLQRTPTLGARSVFHG